MVTILRGVGKPNAISKVCDELLKDLKKGHSVKCIDTSVYRAWLSKYKDNIVHSMFVLYTPLVKHKSKIITTIYDMIPLMYLGTLSNSVVKLQYKIAYKNLGKADKIVSICDFTKKEIVRLLGIDEDKIKTIYLGVHHNLFNDRIKREDAIEKLGLSPNYRYITCVSNVAINKNLQLLIIASNRYFFILD